MTEPTPTQVRHLQNQIDLLSDRKEHRSALKEGMKSLSWEKVEKNLRKKRRNFDHQLVEAFEDSDIPTPNDLYGRLDTIWESEVLDQLPSTDKSLLRSALETAATRVVTKPLGRPVVAQPFTSVNTSPTTIYAEFIGRVNEWWGNYREKCIRMAKKKAEKRLEE